MTKVTCIGELTYGKGKNDFSRCKHADDHRICVMDGITIEEYWDENGDVHYVCMCYDEKVC